VPVPVFHFVLRRVACSFCEVFACTPFPVLVENLTGVAGPWLSRRGPSAASRDPSDLAIGGLGIGGAGAQAGAQGLAEGWEGFAGVPAPSGLSGVISRDWLANIRPGCGLGCSCAKVEAWLAAWLLFRGALLGAGRWRAAKPPWCLDRWVFLVGFYAPGPGGGQLTRNLLHHRGG